MKILVTGGAGFIGSHVVDAFLTAGHDVCVVDDLSSGRLSNLDSRARFYQLDIRDPALAEVFEAERPDLVDHHAAQMDVRKSVADPMFDADVNVRGTLNVLECARRSGTRKIIYISTGGAVYGEPVYLPCDEAHPVNPICQYGVSKHVVEHYLYVYRELYGMDYVVLRYPNVYGPRQNPHGEAGVVAIFTGRMLANEPVTIFGTGDQERDFVHVSDCARANVLAADLMAGNAQALAQRAAAAGQAEQLPIYNLGCGEGSSINLLFAELRNIIGYQHEPIYAPAKAGETQKIYLDSRRARAALGWTPSISLAQGLADTVAYLGEHERKG
jgi:UDP-glucose 4-epimerase